MVLRLCTDEDRIEEYWNNVDKELEIELEVLDDLTNEGTEINKVNNWFTYGEPLHKLREWYCNNCFLICSNNKQYIICLGVCE